MDIFVGKDVIFKDFLGYGASVKENIYNISASRHDT